MKQIPLSQGKFAIVDDGDYDFLMQWKWHVCVASSTYAMRNSDFDNDGRRYHIMMHRVINNTPPGLETDHINGDGLDNRRKNLRTVTRSQNMWNRKKNSKGSSKYKGVYWHKQHEKWVANIQVNKKRHFIGLFVDEDVAGRAYAEKSKAEFKSFNREVNYE